MKKTLAKQSLLSLVAGFFLFGLMLLSANRAGAQDINHNWMQSDNAQQVLKAEVGNLSSNLGLLQPGSPAYNDVLSHIYLYKEVYRDLVNNGTDVRQAVENGVGYMHSFDPSGNTSVVAPQPAEITVNATLLTTLQADITDLLTF